MNQPEEAVEAQLSRLTLEMLEILIHDVCTICQVRFAVRDYVVGLSCTHGFHYDCFRSLVEM